MATTSWKAACATTPPTPTRSAAAAATTGWSAARDRTASRAAQGTDEVRYTERAEALFINVPDLLANDGSAADDRNGQRDNIGPDVESTTGGRGDDNIFGSVGAGIINGFGGNDRINAGAGNDTVYGGAGGDVIEGGDGVDFANYDDHTTGNSLVSSTFRIFVSVGDGPNDGNTIDANQTDDVRASIEGVRGTESTDVLIGLAQAGDRLEGRGGRDCLLGRGGDDVLLGGGGDDSFGVCFDHGIALGYEAGGDTIDGGAGVDQMEYDDAVAGVSVTLNGGTVGDDGQPREGDTLRAIDRLVLTAFADTATVVSGEGRVELDGRDGDDRLTGMRAPTPLGRGGRDLLEGAAGDDLLSGITGDDVLAGMDGNDTLVGGADSDAPTAATATTTCAPTTAPRAPRSMPWRVTPASTARRSTWPTPAAPGAR